MTKQTVLRSYIPDDWGRQVAAEMITETAEQTAALRDPPPEFFAVRVVGRLVATLGQALVYATGDQLQAHPALDHARAADEPSDPLVQAASAGPATRPPPS